MIQVRWIDELPDGAARDERQEFARALRAAYGYAYRQQIGKPRDLELSLCASVLSWSVAHRRMLLRVLLGLAARGLLDTPTINRGMGRWGLVSERGTLAPAARPVDALRLAWPGLGTLLPGSALVVGDRPGAGWSGRLNWPFISGHRGGCSAWLAEQLEAGGVPETRLRWVNATTQDGTPTEAAWIAELQPRLVVALGRNALRWCQDHLLVRYYAGEVHEVHHPQHWKRFHAGHAYHLVKVLQRGLDLQPPRKKS